MSARPLHQLTEGTNVFVEGCRANKRATLEVSSFHTFTSVEDILGDRESSK